MNLRTLKCLIFGHAWRAELTWRGHSGQEVRIVPCCRCGGRWVMSDAHRAFLRYDNDPEFLAGLRKLYPQVRNWHL